MLNQDIFASYTQKSVTFNGIEYFESISIDNDGNVSVWDVKNRILLKDFENLQLIDNEIVIIGTGFKNTTGNDNLIIDSISENTDYEIMDSVSAIRTFNILKTENRIVSIFFKNLSIFRVYRFALVPNFKMQPCFILNNKSCFTN